MYVFDTDTCIEFLRGNLPYALKTMQSCPPELFGIPAVVEAELRLGAHKSARPQENRLAVERFLAPLPSLPFDSQCAIRYGEIRAALEKAGKKIGPNNLLIAATAMANNATLVTNNIKEFKHIKGLTLESWAEIDF